MNRDIWSIVFNDLEEAWLVTQQLKSLIYFKNTLDYNLVINESDIKQTKNLLRKHGFFNLTNQAEFAVNLYSRQELIDNNHYAACGYIDQQLIKLRVYKKSKCAESVILDGKNIAIKEDPLKDFSPRSHRQPYSFYGWWEHCLDKWNNGNIKYPRPVSTPYLFKNQILESLENEFEDEIDYFRFLKQEFPPKKEYFKALQRNVSHPNYLSEFIIYNMFEQHVDENYVELHISPTTSCPIQQGNELPEKNDSFISIRRKFVKQIGIERAGDLVKKYTGWS